MEKYIKEFGKHFNLSQFTQFEEHWTEIIGEPYKTEEFEKCLIKFVKRINKLNSPKA